MAPPCLRCFAILAIIAALLQQACGDGGSGPSGAAVATTIAVNAGNNQSAATGAVVATAPSVKVTDADANPVSGVRVTFAVTSGGGSITGASQTTNAAGIATVGSWTLGSPPGTNTLTATAVGLTGSPIIFTATGITTFQRLLASSAYTCGLAIGGAAYCWGWNLKGQLGDGTTNDRLMPVAVAGGLSFQSLSTGTGHACGVSSGGAAYCWGSNNRGQLGDGTTTDRLIPVAVAGALTFQSLTALDAHTCGLTTGGAAYCWGYNVVGQLGDGTTTDRWTPVAVAGGLMFQSLIAGGNGAHTCGLTTDGRAHCWGLNRDGQLGEGTTSDRWTPVAIAGGLTFVGLDGGIYHTCGVRTGGTAFCWGRNSSGELGDGTFTPRSSPVAVVGGLTFQSIAAGGSHTCAVATSGAGYCWGYALWGQLGVPEFGLREPIPVAVSGGLTFQSITAGISHSCGLTTGGAAYCWGYNAFGGLGDGTTTERTSPVAVRSP